MLEASARIAVIVSETRNGKRSEAGHTKESRDTLSLLWNLLNDCTKAVAKSHDADPGNNWISPVMDAFSTTAIQLLCEMSP
jgi:hypothetical protein